eukprot:9143512-Alexandrium_andersonii.AAC.1
MEPTGRRTGGGHSCRSPRFGAGTAEPTGPRTRRARRPRRAARGPRTRCEPRPGRPLGHAQGLL